MHRSVLWHLHLSVAQLLLSVFSPFLCTCTAYLLKAGIYKAEKFTLSRVQKTAARILTERRKVDPFTPISASHGSVSRSHQTLRCFLLLVSGQASPSDLLKPYIPSDLRSQNPGLLFVPRGKNWAAGFFLSCPLPLV